MNGEDGIIAAIEGEGEGAGDAIEFAERYTEFPDLGPVKVVLWG